MRITAVEAIPVSAPFPADAPEHLRRPAAHYQAVPRRGQDAVLVRVGDSDGNEGWGEAWGLPVPRAAAEFVTELFAPALVGVAVADVAARWQMLAEHAGQLGHADGCGFDALSGIDLALHDLQARRAGVPLHAWLGQPARRPVTCYAAPVPLLADPAASAAAAQALIALGHRALKLKIGRGAARDAADVAAVRAAVGADVRLRVDANAAYDLETAVAVAEHLAPADITWFEDPLAGYDPQALAALRRRCPIPLATGEQLHTPAAYARLVTAAAVDVLVVNLARCGGISGLRAIIALAAPRGVAVSLHGVGTGLLQAASLHAALALLPTDAVFEWNIFPNDLRRGLIDVALDQHDGGALPPSGPGLGCALVAAAVERYRVDHVGVG